MSARFEVAPFLRVTLSHEYHTDGRCAGLGFAPTPATAALLQRHRLRFRADAHGFGIYGPIVRPGGPGTPTSPDVSLDPGARLVFAVTLLDPALLGASDLPFAPKPAQMYLLRRRPGQTRLTAAATVGAGDLVRLAGRLLRLSLTAADEGRTLLVSGPGGHPLHQGTVPPLGDPPEQAVDLGGFEGGLVSVRIDGVEREQVFVDDDLLADRPFAAVELAADAAEVWPSTQVVNGVAVLASLTFDAAFAVRRSLWRYHLLRRQGSPITGTFRVLATVTPPPYPAGLQFAHGTVPEVAGLFPDREVFSFTSSVPLPFFEVPLPRLVLENTAGGKTFNLHDNLPNPPRALTRPDVVAPNTFVSDVFLHL